MAQANPSPRFHDLPVSRVTPEAAGAVAISFAVPPALRESFKFEPGQFLTLRAQIGSEDVRRSYSICSASARYRDSGELEVGIRPMEGGLFSNWAAKAVKVGDVLPVMPPDGRFVSKRARAIHRVGFAAGSGITPILSIIATSLQEQPNSKFTLVYGNRSMASVMFNEALQDLKDRYLTRLTLIHILSRQAQEVDLLHGRIDAAKVKALVAALLPAFSMDEVFICGPEAMIEATQGALGRLHHAFWPANEDFIHAVGRQQRRNQCLHFCAINAALQQVHFLRLTRQDVNQRQAIRVPVFEVLQGLIEHHAGHAAVAINQREFGVSLIL